MWQSAGIEPGERIVWDPAAAAVRKGRVCSAGRPSMRQILPSVAERDWEMQQGPRRSLEVRPSAEGPGRGCRTALCTG